MTRARSILPFVAGLAACAPQAAAPCPAPPPPQVAPAAPSAGRDEPLQPSSCDVRGGAGGSENDTALLRQMALTRGYRLGRPTAAKPTADGKTVLFLRSAARDAKQSLYALDVASGAVRELSSPDSLMAGPETLSPEERVLRQRMRVHQTGFTSLDLSEDGREALVTLSGRAFVVDVATGKARELPTGKGAVIDPRFSPDGARVAYVRDDDVHVVDVKGGRERAVTRGGKESVTHGLAEFVAAEELDRARGFWWSPDGRHILYEEADMTGVDVLSIADPLHPEQPPQRIAYPRPGRPNADVRFGVVSSSGGPTKWVQWDRARFPYVAQARWPKGGPPLLYVLDRLQRAGQLLSVDAATGKATMLVEERDSAWLNVDPTVPRWLPDGTGFLWASEASGRNGDWQLELRDATGRLVRELLPKGFGYVSLADVDDERRAAVVVASDDPTQSLTWSVSLDGRGAPRRIGPDRGVVHPAFGASHDVYVSTEARLDAAPRTMVRSVDGVVERELPSVAESPSPLPVAELSEVGPDRVRVAIVRPRGSRPDHRYPVIDAAYGGPHHTVVRQDALAYALAQWMADATGAIVVAIDGRGTPRRGRDWERAIAGKLGEVPLEDHVAAIRALGASHAEMDVSRVGVYGWSFGGYFSAMAVLARPDVYDAAMAGAPPADWRDYDTAYTERYLGLPDENAAAYDAASLLTWARNPPAPGGDRPLLVVHGTADDNVWFLNGVKLADALERGKRRFQLLPLAGTTHMLLDPDLDEAVWLRAAQMFREALKPWRPSAP